jgi:hypothetical protein
MLVCDWAAESDPPRNIAARNANVIFQHESKKSRLLEFLISVDHLMHSELVTAM